MKEDNNDFNRSYQVSYLRIKLIEKQADRQNKGKEKKVTDIFFFF